MRGVGVWLGLPVVALGLTGACTQDFEDFRFVSADGGGAAGTEATAGAAGLGLGGSGAALGASGAPQGGFGGVGGSGGSPACDAGQMVCGAECIPMDDAHCGGCDNDCTAQGLSCVSAGFCGCTEAQDCGGSDPACGLIIRTCRCAGNFCQPGETCEGDQCSCNGGPPCAFAEVCCQTPSGCVDVLSDDENCGACGNRCGRGQSCSNGVCG